MGTQILAGSQGNYRPKFIIDKTIVDNNKKFIVTQDTCIEAVKLPIKFLDTSNECWIFMKDANFTLKIIQDY